MEQACHWVRSWERLKWPSLFQVLTKTHMKLLKRWKCTWSLKSGTQNQPRDKIWEEFPLDSRPVGLFILNGSPLWKEPVETGEKKNRPLVPTQKSWKQSHHCSVSQTSVFRNLSPKRFGPSWKENMVKRKGPSAKYVSFWKFRKHVSDIKVFESCCRIKVYLIALNLEFLKRS